MSLDSEMHLRLTRRFIDEDPSEIEVVRVPKVSDGKGGYKRAALEAETLAFQTIRKVPSGFKGDLATRTTASGREVKPTSSVVGMPSLDIQIGDEFLLDGVWHEVVFVNTRPQWRITAECVEQTD